MKKKDGAEGFVMHSGPSEGGACEVALKYFSMVLVALTFPLSIPFCLRVVNEYERAVIFRLGRVDRNNPAKGPGLFFILPCIDELKLVDLRIRTYDVPPQEILTKDSVTVLVDAVINYFIFDPIHFALNAQNAITTTNLLAQTTLRNVLGTFNLAGVLSEKEEINTKILQLLDPPTDTWGIRVTQVSIKDVKLPQSMQRAMAAEAEAHREAKAKIVAAEGEQKSSLALKEAAAIMAQAPFSFQLRLLQTLTTISAEKNSTIVVPLPIEILRGFVK